MKSGHLAEVLAHVQDAEIEISEKAVAVEKPAGLSRRVFYSTALHRQGRGAIDRLSMVTPGLKGHAATG